ncbi:MAG TPA: hypothetical protein VJV39_16250 [Dongiaceae bacterium]|nr:hypothetical protein [Dongiaceae bacterium]
MDSSWPRLCLSLWSLTFEASHVILLRAFAIAAGGAPAKNEIDRMVDEKVKALYALQSLLVTGALGFTTSTMAARSVAHYRKAVRANRRRLERSGHLAA